MPASPPNSVIEDRVANRVGLNMSQTFHLQALASRMRRVQRDGFKRNADNVHSTTLTSLNLQMLLEELNLGGNILFKEIAGVYVEVTSTVQV